MSSSKGVGQFLCVVLCLCLAACGGGGGRDSSNTIPDPVDDSSPDVSIDIEVELLEAFSGTAFIQPVALLQMPANNNRWLVVERAGRVFDMDQTGVVQSEFLDITSRVDSGPSEAGLLGLALHPEFATNGFAFLSYTISSGSGIESVVARYTSFDGGFTLDPDSEEVLLSVVQDFGNHNGGQLAFGADGYLYVGLGDGGSGDDPNNRAQDTTNLMGTFSRIDVDNGAPYGIPEDNPFAGNALCNQGFGGADCPEIFAWGLRNPWRWSFDSESGDLWAGDVGQNRFEEVNLIRLGRNYGWRITEGSECNIPATGCQTDDLFGPSFSYDHSLGQSITGGFVYRGSTISNLDGFFVYGDFVSGTIWALATFSNGPVVSPTPVVPDNIELLTTDLNIASFAQDSEGELYVIDYSSGKIYSLQ